MGWEAFGAGLPSRVFPFLLPPVTRNGPPENSRLNPALTPRHRWRQGVPGRIAKNAPLEIA